MKVFLGNAPWYREGHYGVRAGSRWPHFEKNEACYMPFPFFLGYAAALLEREKIPVFLVDGIADRLSEDEFFRKLLSYRPDLVLLEVSTASLELDRANCRRVRELFGDEVRLAITGADISLWTPRFFQDNPAVDYVLKGEYEFTLLELVRCLEADDDLSRVEGLCYRDGDGVFRKNPDRPLFDDLDSMPWPARHFLPMDKYNDTPGGIPQPSVQMWASRGCPFGCIFCVWPQIVYGSSKYRTRDPVLFVDEMEWLVRKAGFRSVYVDDDTFNIGKPRIMKICAEMKRRHLIVPWAIMARADTMDREMLIALKETGLQALKYGVESADQGILDTCGKRLDIDKVIETVKFTRELDINMHLTFAFGLPGETRETAQRTIDLALELNPDTLQFSIITPFPGSKYYDMLKHQGKLLTEDTRLYDGYSTAVLRTDALSGEELQSILQTANREWEQHVIKRQVMHHDVPELIRRGIRDPRKAMRKLKGLLGLDRS